MYGAFGLHIRNPTHLIFPPRLAAAQALSGVSGDFSGVTPLYNTPPSLAVPLRKASAAAQILLLLLIISTNEKVVQNLILISLSSLCLYVFFFFFTKDPSVTFAVNGSEYF